MRMVPASKLASSGRRASGAMRSAVGRFLPGMPLVVRQRMTSVSARRAVTTWRKASMSWAPLPSASRTCTWTIAAPARQAAMPSAAISSGDTGMAGDCSLVMREPVRAAVMMTGGGRTGPAPSAAGDA